MMSVANLHTVFSTVYPEEGRLLEFVLTLQMFNERAAAAAGCPVRMTPRRTRVRLCTTTTASTGSTLQATDAGIHFIIVFPSCVFYF